MYDSGPSSDSSNSSIESTVPTLSCALLRKITEMAYSAVLSLMQILRQILDPDYDVLHEKQQSESLSEKIIRRIFDPHHYVLHKKQQIESLQEKVSFLLDFLEQYSMFTDETVEKLERKIRDTVYKAEDIIESYVSTLILSKSNGTNKRERYQTFCEALEKVIADIGSIQEEALKINDISDPNYMQQKTRLPVDKSRLTFGDRIPMVGLVEDSSKIKEWLTSSSSRREVISIVGMGGIGKTTFARNVFDDSLVRDHFDSRAWATVSQEYRVRDILASLLSKLEKRKEDTEVEEQLYKCLKSCRYLIFLDDLWDTKAWDEVKRFFPEDNNGSRIILTTRLTDVAVHAASSDHIHDMSLLSSGESWKLLSEKAFGGECCPPSLEDIGQEIARNCRGLPLSVVVLGGLLSMNKTTGYWETVLTTMNALLATDGSQCSEILTLSYNHLPTHLKPCFLYFAVFPEDCDIRRSKVIKLWVAEGFVRPDNSKSLEETADEYLKELVNRSLVMVHKLGHDGKVKKYRIHDLLRGFCTREVGKEKFLFVVPSESAPNLHEGIRGERRVCIHPKFPPEDYIDYVSNSYSLDLLTRSLLFHHSNVELCISSFVGFRLLRVMDIEAIKLDEFPIGVVELVHLRYLCLYFKRGSVPPSISKIWNLQTLIIIRKVLTFIPLPREVWTMAHLRHVRVENCYLPTLPSVGVALEHLKTLWMTQNLRLTLGIIERIRNLKKLGVYYDVVSAMHWSYFHLSNMVCLNELETLEFTCNYPVSFPSDFKFPLSLKKLTLWRVSLPWKDLTIAGSLPNLDVLKIQLDGCKGEVWEPNEGEFPRLKYLQIYQTDLVHWRADDSHFPELMYLYLYRCERLKEIPVEIGNINTLEMIDVVGSSSTAKASARLILEEQRSLDNYHLQVRISDW